MLHLKRVVSFLVYNVIEIYASVLDICICHINNTECVPNTQLALGFGVSVEQGCIYEIYTPAVEHSHKKLIGIKFAF